MNALTLDDFRSRLTKVKGNTARCPAHDDHNNSFTFGKGDKGGIVFTCHAGCSYGDILAAMGLVDADVMPGSDPRQDFAPRKREQRQHDYPGGYKVIFAGKGAAWYHFENGKAVKGKPPGITVYNPDALQGDPIYIVEGEKDVDTLTRLGNSAVCGSNGAGPGKWPKEVNHRFKGKYVVILGDHDDVGRAFAIETANNLHGIASMVKLVDLADLWPEIPEHGDISDYIAKFGDKAIVEIASHVMGLPEYSPQKDQAPSDTVEAFETITAIELSKKDLPPVKWVVKDLLPQGEALLVAPSKYGKGWFAIDLSLSVSGGWPFLGFEVVQTEVLYLALEDSYRRLKSRQQLILGFDEAPTGLTFAIRAKTIDNGLANQIDAHMAQNPNTGLIIIDVLQKVRSTKVQRGMGAYALDYNDMTQIKAMADKYDITILCVHHDRKMKDSEDPFNQISGTNAIMGSADTIMLITKKARNDGRAVLMVTGRDVESQDYVMELDLKKTYRWQRVATVEEEEYNQELEEYNSEPVVKTIKGLLAMSPGGIELTASEIQNHMPIFADTMMSDKAIGKAINRLAPALYNHDKIRHLFGREGRARKHRFFKPGYVFPFEMPNTEGETS